MLSVVALSLAGIIFFVHHENQQALNQIKAEEKYMADAIFLKESLEKCNNQTSNNQIRLDGFNMLLAHVIEQNMPHEKLKQQLDTCIKSL